MIAERLVTCREYPFGYFGTAVNVMRPIDKDLRLHNRNQPILLADDCVPGQAIGVLIDRQLGRFGRADLQHGSPLGKTGPNLVELGAALAEAVVALGGGLAVGPRQLDGTLVDPDARKDPTLLQDLDEWLSISSLLVEGLLKEDDTA